MRNQDQLYGLSERGIYFLVTLQQDHASGTESRPLAAVDRSLRKQHDNEGQPGQREKGAGESRAVGGEKKITNEE